MKKLVLTLLLGVTTLTAFAQVPSYVPTSGLVGYWPFNGNANDESGNGNNGTVNGATLTTDRNGIINNCYSFNNNDIKVDIKNNQFLNDFSISGWIYLDENSKSSSYPTFITEENNYITLQYAIWPSGAAPIFNMYFLDNYNIGGQQVEDGHVQSPSNFNQWHFFVLNNKNKINTLYIDGILKVNSNSASNIQGKGNGTFLRFGKAQETTANVKFIGKIDDIGIYNRALTQQEITALYTGCTSLTATITPQSTTTFCQNGSVVLNASTGTGYTYEWYKNGTIINGSTTSSYTANQTGSYTLKVINGSCNATSIGTAVTVNPNPTVSLANLIHIKSAPITLSGSPSGGAYSGAGVVGSIFSSTNAGLGKKTITYNYKYTTPDCICSATAITTVYDTTACSTFDTLFINIAVAGLTAPNNLGTLKIWPNPANDHITIDNGNFSILNGYSVKIETVLGQEVFKSAINQQQFSVDLSTWKGKGIYLVHVLDGQSNIIETKKIILQ